MNNSTPQTETLQIKFNNVPSSARTVEAAARSLYGGRSFTHQASANGVEINLHGVRSQHDCLEAVCNALAKTDWYWFDGSAYCPACVLCESPAIDAADSRTQRGRGASVCSCCGTDYADTRD